MRLALFLLTATAFAQTRVALVQLQGVGTSPNLVWQSGLKGQRVNSFQVEDHAVAIVQVEGVPLRLQTIGIANCTLTLRRNFVGLIQVVVAKGRVGILAGGNRDGRYYTTADEVEIEGPCVPIDTEEGRYPTTINAFLYFGAKGMLTDAALLKIVPTLFMPSSYALDGKGLISVSGAGGEIAKP